MNPNSKVLCGNMMPRGTDEALIRFYSPQLPRVDQDKTAPKEDRAELAAGQPNSGEKRSRYMRHMHSHKPDCPWLVAR